MATAAKQVCRQARQLSSHRTQWLSIRQTPQVVQLHQQQRNFSKTTKYNAEPEASKDGSSKSESAPYFNKSFFNRLDQNDQSTYRNLTAAERKQMERVSSTLHDEFSTDSRTHRDLEESIRTALLEVEHEFPEEMAEREPRNDGFFQMGEKEDIGPDDEFAGDDISSTAHAELEQHREIREFARNAAWEMPLLASMFSSPQPS